MVRLVFEQKSTTWTAYTFPFYENITISASFNIYSISSRCTISYTDSLTTQFCSFSLNIFLYLESDGFVLRRILQQGHHNPSHFMKISHLVHLFTSTSYRGAVLYLEQIFLQTILYFFYLDTLDLFFNDLIYCIISFMQPIDNTIGFCEFGKY